jgi:putative ABC transport system permease protein
VSRASRGQREVPVGLATPFRMFRFPTVAVAIAGVCAIAAVTLGVGPVLLASGGSAALRDGLRGLGPEPIALTAVSGTSFYSGAAERIEHTILGETKGLPLGPPVVTALGPVANVRRLHSHHLVPIQFITRQGFQSHVDVVEGPKGDGAWLPLSVAKELRVHPGDRIFASASAAAFGLSQAKVRVAAVYRDLDAAHLSDFWDPVVSKIQPRTPDAPQPPPFLQANLDEFGRLLASLNEVARLELDFPFSRTLTLSEAEAASRRFRHLSAEVSDPGAPLFGTFTSVSSNVPSVVAAARRTVDGTTQPVRAISLAGGLLALIAAAVTGRFMARRRSAEYAMLSARGVGPFRLGVRTIVEGTVPAALGAAAGVVAVVILVRALGPGGRVGPEAVRASIRVIALSFVAVLLAFGLVTGRSIRSEEAEQSGRLRDGMSRFPWEAVALALAFASLYEILTHRIPPADTAPHVDLLVLLFPFLFIAGTVGLAARAGRRLLPRLRAVGARRSDAQYLAFARLASAPRLALTLVSAAALGLGVLVYGGVLSSSLASTAGEKAALSLGSDVVVAVGSTPTVPGRPPFGWTPVEVVSPITVVPGGAQANLMIIDRSSFPGGAFWDPRFDGPIDRAMDSLAARGSALPVIAVGGRLAPGARLDLSGSTVPLEIANSVRYFPGASDGTLTLVADRAAVARTVDVDLRTLGHRYELWAKGDPDRVLPALAALGFPAGFAETSAEVRTSPAFLALDWTFGLLEALGVLAGIVAGIATILYLQARQRSREVSYALARRMGLRRRAHRRSVFVETGCMLVVAFVLGTVFAVLAAALVHGRLDPIPGLPPGPLLRVPWGAVATTAIITVVVAAIGAWRVQAVADRARIGEVMRLA